jgi:alpha-1,6-mannosyltransferase
LSGAIAGIGEIVRILQIANFVSPASGGLKVAIDALKSGYENKGWVVGQITPFSSPDAWGGEVPISSSPLPFSGSYRVFLGRQALKNAIHAFKPDIVELSDKSTLAWVSKWCSKRNIPCCVISHERMDFAIKRTGIARLVLQQFNRRWTSIIANSSTVVVCASRFAAEEFSNTSAKVRIIPLGVRQSNHNAQILCKQDAEEIKVVMCCRLSEEKQPKLCIDAMRLLAGYRKASLTVIGEGPMRGELQALASGLNVTFRGHVSNRAEVMRLLSEADVALSLGVAETFGLTTVEALSVGTPVVVASTGASREIVSPLCGRIVESRPNAVAAAIVDLVGEERNLQRVRCIEQAQRFDIDQTVDQFVKMYLEVTRGEAVLSIA